MKNLSLIFCAVGVLYKLSIAQNFYISSSAPAGGSGTMLSPWNNFTPLNSLLATNATIDTIYLKCGDIFRGQITVTTVSDFVITSYGTGMQPVISGADTVSNWTYDAAKDYWVADYSQPMTHFFANNREQILARYPNEGTYMILDAGTTNTTLIDDDLGAISSAIINTSQVCVHTAQWCWEKSPVASSTSNSITYLNPTTVFEPPTAGYGYFLYDHLSFLDTLKEWKYDEEEQKIYYKPISGNPNTQLCEASVHNYGIVLDSGVSHITIRNIAFEKQIEAGIGFFNESNQYITIDACKFARQYHYGVAVGGKYASISNNYFREVDGIAVHLTSSATASIVHHNIFRNNGGFRNSGIGQQINLTSIHGNFVDSCHIHHNDIDSAGYCGISMDGKYNLIERNMITNVMLLNNDGAALKSFSENSQYNIYQNNFISKGDGNTEGAPAGPPESYFITPAIYFDFNTRYCTIRNNTIYDRSNKGIFLNTGTNHNTVTGNVVHGGNNAIHYNGSPLMPTAMTGMTVKRNIFFSKDPSAYIIRMVDNTDGYHHGVIDSNYYFQPYNPDNYALIPATDDSYNFSEWQTVTGYDAHTQSSFVLWTLPVAEDTLLMNPTDDVITISLNEDIYQDLDSNVVCGSVTLQPYTSQILIKTNTSCSDPIFDLSYINHAISISPNPFSSYTTISVYTKVDNATLTIYNLFGQVVKQIHPVSNQPVTLHRENMQKGYYLLELKQDDTILATDTFIIMD